MNIKIELKNKLLLLIVLIFVVCSLLYFSKNVENHNNLMHSSYDLNTLEKVEGNTIVCSFIDENGNIVFADNKDYAIVRKTIDSECRVVLEEFFDENNIPTKQPGGFYAIKYEYDEKGIFISYLNADGRCMLLPNGYAIIHRTVDEFNRPLVDTYYDCNMRHAKCNGEFYSYRRIYTENNVIIGQYQDINGDSIDLSYGYSKVERTIDSEGRVLVEKFYDRFGNKISLSNGEFGYRYSYDKYGRVLVKEFLDINEKPMINRSGYTQVQYTYLLNDKIAKEMYCDADGNYIKSNKGQYGISHSKERVSYLNKEGKPYFHLDTFLESYPYCVVLVALLLCCVVYMSSTLLRYLIMCSYMLFILYETICFRISGGNANLQLLWSYTRIFIDRSLGMQILQNFWLFVPLGAVLYVVLNKRIRQVLIFIVLISTMIEFVQYYGCYGLCEIDDIISNTIGGLFGVSIIYLIDYISGTTKEKSS